MTDQLDTNLNAAPYFNDFDASKGYYRTLFKPSTPVQVRELNSLQDMLYHQVYRFGQNIFVTGTIVDGCNISSNKSLCYVKITDTYTSTAILNVNDIVGNYLVSNSGLKAFVVNGLSGYVATAPNLNTLYVGYLNSAVNATTNAIIQTFQNDEVLNVVNPANVVLSQITVANTISSGSSNTTGYAYSLSVDKGVIFQKGMFLEVNPQSIIISPYTNLPNNISVGFSSVESIVTSFQDTNLLDNSAGSTNYAAPGADRLKVTPTLITVNTNQANVFSNNFFSIADFVNGQAAFVNQDTTYSTLGNYIAGVSNDTNGSFIIKPFNIRLKKIVNANGSIDATNLRLEVDKGLAYINGRKVNLLGQLLSITRKGTDVAQANTQILTAQYGNYVYVQEVAGILDPTILQTVTLRDTVALGVSNNLAKGINTNAITPPGNMMGTATLVGFKYNSGIESEANSQYLAYLYNIQMTNGSFANVKSIYANNSNIIGVADIVQVNNTTVLQSPTLRSGLYSFNQQAVKTIKTAANTTDIQFTYKAKATVTFATTGNVSITVPTAVGGTNQLPYGVGNLTPTQIASDIIVVAEANVHSANVAGSATVSAANVQVTGSATAFNTALTPGAFITLANSTVTETKQVNAITNATFLTTTAPFSSGWTSANVYVTYLAGDPIPLATAGANVSVVNSTSMTVTLPSSVNNTFSATVFYNILKTGASPATKSYQTTVYATIYCSNNAGGTTGPWCLGVPDVVSVSNVWVGSTLSTSNPSLTSQFTLNNGQQDSLYSLAYLQNYGATLSGTNVILVEMQAFIPNYSSGTGFFTIDSYPVDDTGVTANSIFTQNIPYYNSIVQQELFNLRNCIDFRAYATNTIPYSTNSVLAVSNTLIVNPNVGITYQTGNYLPPTPDSLIEASFQYYMGRYETVGLSNTGQIIQNNGVAAENPIPPGDIHGGMTLAYVYIPPYPSLTTDVVNTVSNPFANVVSLTYKGNRRYTMADIGLLDNRISQVEYYTSLSQLEQNAQNLQLTNADGTTRFQYGILVDPMNDFSIANTTDPAFNIAIDATQSLARPTFSQYPVDLKYNTGGNTVISGDGRLISLPYTQVGPFVSQPFASQERNASQFVTYVWQGQVHLTPDGDYQPDVTTNPSVTVNLNDYSNWAQLANAWPTQWGTWVEAVNTSVYTYPTGTGGTTTTIATSTTNTRFGTSTGVSPVSTNYSFGDVVTSVGIQPFVRSQLIEFATNGLKPTTRHWVFFNDVNVTNNCVQTSKDYSTILSTTSLVTDANGHLYGVFNIPANTFHTGSITLSIMDIANVTTQNNIITSVGTSTYYATNLAYTQNNLDLTTTTAQVSTVQQVQTITSNTVVSYTTTSGPTAYGNGKETADPLAQSFMIIQEQLPSNVQGVYATSIDLFFASKDPTLGITLQIRNMDDTGSITDEIVPFSQVYILPSQVNTSLDSSVATNITFPAPVLLESGSSYAFVLIPDGSNPNYDVWTAVIGGNDVITGNPIYSFSTVGDMFLSSQGSTWTPYQNENVKFNLYIANFTALQGNANLTNDDLEFMNLAGTTGRFQLGESVVFSNTVIAAANATIINASANVTVVSTTGLANGNIVAVIPALGSTNAIIRTVNTVVNSTFFTTTANLNATNTAFATVVKLNGVSGKVRQVNSSFLTVNNSNANTTSYLPAAVGYVIGANSGAYSNATLVDIVYDTIMPKLAVSIPAVASLALSMSGVSNGSTSYTSDVNNTSLTFAQDYSFFDKERVVMSKSNEGHYKAGAKSYYLNANLASNSAYLSPVIDTVKMDAYTVYNQVNGESGNTILLSEINNFGNALNKYISTTVTLASGLQAEDLVVYVGAYYPPGSSIYVYGKIQNQYDSDNFGNKPWTPMFTNNTVRSSLINTHDYNEYIYTFPTVNTAATTAYLDKSNNYTVSYVTANGQAFETFNTFAVKIVLLSNSSVNVPMVTDYRAICCTSNT